MFMFQIHPQCRQNETHVRVGGVFLLKCAPTVLQLLTTHATGLYLLYAIKRSSSYNSIHLRPLPNTRRQLNSIPVNVRNKLDVLCALTIRPLLLFIMKYPIIAA